MAELSFQGETHDEIVQKVRRWLASVDGADTNATTANDIVTQSAELTKDALAVIAKSAPGPIAQSDLFKALTTMGYRATDATRDATLSSLDAVETATGGSVVRKITESGSQALFEMNAQVAKALLKNLMKD
ncbi:MAG: hypothetical protein R2733_07655 [Acidimicrobiales bacterium]